ncbi:MAG TPA: hypothetical protein VFY29_17070, partial [Terriglobia bacterium]|nr:hypothetical protein [Terriglobia bacterium]
SLGVGPRGPGVFALVDMKKDEDPAPSPGRARDIVRIDTVDVSEEMGVRDAIARAASGYAVTKPDGSRWARPMESGLVDIAFLVEEGPKPEANVEWDWEQFRLRLTRDVHAGEELRLAAVGETGE